MTLGHMKEPVASFPGFPSSFPSLAVWEKRRGLGFSEGSRSAFPVLQATESWREAWERG